MPASTSPPRSAADPCRLLRLRLGGRRELQEALLDAVFACRNCALLDTPQRRRLQALLEERDDVALEALAWRGDAGRSTLSVQVDVLLDGTATAAESDRACAALVQLLRQADWLPDTLVVRSVLVGDCKA